MHTNDLHKGNSLVRCQSELAFRPRATAALSTSLTSGDRKLVSMQTPAVSYEARVPPSLPDESDSITAREAFPQRGHWAGQRRRLRGRTLEIPLSYPAAGEEVTYSQRQVPCLTAHPGQVYFPNGDVTKILFSKKEC